MADQIALRVAESIVSAGSAVVVTANFRDRATAAASTPATIRYRVDCLTNQTALVEWQSVSAASSATITVPGTSNGTINRGAEFEERQITVEIDTDLSTQARAAVKWRARNILTFDELFTFPEALQLEPFFTTADVESGLTIEHPQYPVGHRFRYLDTFDVVDAHYYRQTEVATPTNYQYPLGNVLRYGADPTGVADSATAIQAAIDSAEVGGSVYVPAGTYLIGSQLSVGDATPILIHGDGQRSIIKKGFNGAMLSLGLKSEITNVFLDGNGANFTGRGIIIQTGNGGDGLQNIHDLTIHDTESYCIEYTASGAGWSSRINNCRLNVYSRPTTAAVKYPDTDVNGPRILSNCVTLGVLADLGASHGIQMIGNICGEDAAMTVPSFSMNSSSLRNVIVGNSFECNTPIEIVGDRHVILGNIMRAGYSLESGATNCVVGLAMTTSGGDDHDVDNSGVPNNDLYSIDHTYTPTWTGAGGNPDIGDGTLSGRWQRAGRRVHLQIDVLMGSTTTYGSGAWTFSLPTVIPTPGNGSSVGAVQISDSGTTNYVGIATVSTGGVTCITHANAVNVGAASPHAWAVNDRLRIDVTYNL